MKACVEGLREGPALLYRGKLAPKRVTEAVELHLELLRRRGNGVLTFMKRPSKSFLGLLKLQHLVSQR